MENRTDKIFKDKLSSFREMPSAKAWEQIGDQLSSAKKRKFYGRLAVAASLILLVGLGYIGIQTLNSVSDLNNVQRSTAVEKTAAEQALIAEEKTNGDKTINNLEVKPESSEALSPKEKKQDKIEGVSDDYTSEEHATEKVNILPKEDKTKQIPTPHTEAPIDLTESILDIDPKPEHLDLPKETIEADSEIVADLAQAKSLPSVRITYKVSKQPTNSNREKQNIINKGLDKLAKFKDEHILTEERKTKLRNTTEDLLALNFGKLLNKTNKEFEN